MLSSDLWVSGSHQRKFTIPKITDSGGQTTLRTRTYTRHVGELTDTEYKQCKSLNLGKNGSMRWELEEVRRNEREAWTYLVKDLDSGILIGWALIFHRHGQDNAHFYVRKKFRRQGYGERLMFYVKRDWGEQIHVSPWNKQAQCFFKSQGFKVKEWNW